MYRIIYSSVETEPMTDDGLEKLLSKARKANKARGVTGMLLYADSGFVQVLEGEQSVLEELMNRITADPRHTNIQVLLQDESDQRGFSRWEMAYVKHDPKDSEIGGIPGVKTHADLTHRLSRNRSFLSRFLQASAERLFEAKTEPA